VQKKRKNKEKSKETEKRFG